MEKSQCKYFLFPVTIFFSVVVMCHSDWGQIS